LEPHNEDRRIEIMKTINDFGDTAKSLSRNPLGIISLFIVLIYAFAVLLVGMSDKLAENERMPLIWFLVIFPFVVILIFSWLVSRHYEKLYAPKDYSDDKYFLSGLGQNFEKQLIKVNESIALHNNVENISKIISKQKKGIKKNNIVIEKDLVFYLTPFDEQYRNTMKIVKDVCDEKGYRCLRGDEEIVKGDLLLHIIELLKKARIIIVNIDGRNLNVFYELGMAHALEKEVYLVAKDMKGVPFDLYSQRIIIWNETSELKEQLIRILPKK
jgi:hypothetical protein